MSWNCSCGNNKNNLTIRDTSGRTALHYASQHGHASTVQLLLQNASNNNTNNNRLLINAVDTSRETALRRAVDECNLPAMRTLLHAHADTTITDFSAGTSTDDKIDLQSVFTDFADVLANTNDDGQGNTIIAKSGVSVTLTGVTKSLLVEDDFVFAAGMSAPFEEAIPEQLALLDLESLEQGWFM